MATSVIAHVGKPPRSFQPPRFNHELIFCGYWRRSESHKNTGSGPHPLDEIVGPSQKDRENLTVLSGMHGSGSSSLGNETESLKDPGPGCRQRAMAKRTDRHV